MTYDRRYAAHQHLVLEEIKRKLEWNSKVLKRQIEGQEDRLRTPGVISKSDYKRQMAYTQGKLEALYESTDEMLDLIRKAER